MTRSVLAIAIATILTGSSAMAQQTTPNPDQSVTGTPADDSRTANQNRKYDDATKSDANRNWDSKESFNKPDEKFLKDFARANASEVETGKLAATKAQHPEVKAFAKHMVDDHSKTIDKVQALASKNNIDVKVVPDMARKSSTDMLDNKDGAAFDRAYIDAQVDGHQKVVTMLQTEIKDGKDADVKQLASQALPDVQKHLKLAKDLQTKVSGTAKTSMRNDSSSTDKTVSDR